MSDHDDVTYTCEWCGYEHETYEDYEDCCDRGQMAAEHEELEAQLAAVTAERDAARAALAGLVGDHAAVHHWDYLKPTEYHTDDILDKMTAGIMSQCWWCTSPVTIYRDGRIEHQQENEACPWVQAAALADGEADRKDV